MSRRVLLATLLGVFLTMFPSVILVAALPDIATAFHVGESSMGWVLTAPTIAGAVLVPLFGKLGDLHGHRRVFLLAFATSGVFAALTGLAWDLGPLIALRSIGQASAVATSPAALALIMATHGPTERPKALGAWALAGATAPVIGLLAGGPLVAALSWRGLFFLQAAVAAVALPFCVKVLPETTKVPAVRFDVAGGITLMIGSGAAVFAIDRSGPWGVGSPGVWIAAAIAPIALWAFVRVERRTTEPLLPLELVRRRAFAAPVIGDALLQAPSFGAFFLAPLLLHATFDRSVGSTAYLLLPMPAGMGVLALIGGRLTVGIGERATAVLGCLVLLLGLGVTAAGNEAESLVAVVVGFALLGAAMGINRPAYSSAAAGALDSTTTGVGMAVMRMTTQLGAAAGISVAVAARSAGGFGGGFLAMAVLTTLATLVATRIVDVQPTRAEDVVAGTAVLATGP